MHIEQAYNIMKQIKRVENGKSIISRAISWTDNVLIATIALKVFEVKFNYWLIIPFILISLVCFFFLGLWYEKKKIIHIESEYGIRNNWLNIEQRAFQKEVLEFVRKRKDLNKRKVHIILTKRTKKS